MKEELISFDVAKLAKEKGFNEPIKKVYNTLGEVWDAHYSYMKNDNVDSGASCTAPTQSLLQKWLREEHEIHPWVQQKATYYFPRVGPYNKGDNIGMNYEEALEIALLEGLKLIK